MEGTQLFLRLQLKVWPLSLCANHSTVCYSDPKQLSLSAKWDNNATNLTGGAHKNKWRSTRKQEILTMYIHQHIQRALHPATAEYTLFSNRHGIFSNMDHMLSHKMSLNKFKRIEIIQRMLTNYYGMKSEIITGRKFGKSQICGN